MIAGSLRGRRLQAPPGTRVRPTSDRAREALFDILGPRVMGSRFLDLYAGTGAVGIEAHSRGAEKVVLVERDRTALAIIERNLDGLGISREISLLRSPWPGALREAACRGGPFTIIFADPPYADAHYESILESLLESPDDEGGPRGAERSRIGEEKEGQEKPTSVEERAVPPLLAREVLIIIEHEAKTSIPADTRGLRLQRRTVYGRIGFGFYRVRA